MILLAKTINWKVKLISILNLLVQVQVMWTRLLNLIQREGIFEILVLILTIAYGMAPHNLMKIKIICAWSDIIFTPFIKLITRLMSEWNETIRVRWEAYIASPLADLTSPFCILICQESFFHPYSKNETKQHTHTRNFDIARLSLSSFLAAYKAQLRKTKFDQIVRNNRFCVMTQLSKTLCYCNKTSTNIFSSLRPMSNFQPHKKKIMASPPKVKLPKQKQQQQQPKLPPPQNWLMPMPILK